MCALCDLTPFPCEMHTGAQYCDSRPSDEDTTARSPSGPAGDSPLQSRGRIYDCNACLVNANMALAIWGRTIYVHCAT